MWENVWNTNTFVILIAIVLFFIEVDRKRSDRVIHSFVFVSVLTQLVIWIHLVWVENSSLNWFTDLREFNQIPKIEHFTNPLARALMEQVYIWEKGMWIWMNLIILFYVSYYESSKKIQRYYQAANPSS